MHGMKNTMEFSISWTERTLLQLEWDRNYGGAYRNADINVKDTSQLSRRNASCGSKNTQLYLEFISRSLSRMVGIPNRDLKCF